MKSIVIAIFLVILTSYAATPIELPFKLGNLKTTDGEEYHDVIITQKTAAGISVTHDSGIGNITWAKIPTETQLILGYDAAAEAATRKKADAEFLAAQKKLREAAAQLPAKELKSILSKFTLSPANTKAWRLTFSDPITAAVSLSYVTPGEWFPIGGMALTREGQLKDALTAKFIQKQGGHGLTDNQVQFLDFETRVGLERHPGHQQVFTLSFPSSHAVAISQQIARYRARLALNTDQALDFGAIGANTFGYNVDKTFRVNEMSFSVDEVFALEFLVVRVPQLQSDIYKALIHE